MPGNNPSFIRESLWHMPQAWTLIRTCAAPGSGTSRSTISKGPLGLETWIARIYPLQELFLFIMFWCSHIHKLFFSLRIVLVVADKLRLQRIIYENAE